MLRLIYESSLHFFKFRRLFNLRRGLKLRHTLSFNFSRQKLINLCLTIVYVFNFVFINIYCETKLFVLLNSFTENLLFFLRKRTFEHLKYNLDHNSNVIHISNRKKYISKLCVLII